MWMPHKKTGCNFSGLLVVGGTSAKILCPARSKALAEGCSQTKGS